MTSPRSERTNRSCPTLHVRNAYLCKKEIYMQMNMPQCGSYRVRIVIVRTSNLQSSCIFTCLAEQFQLNYIYIVTMIIIIMVIIMLIIIIIILIIINNNDNNNNIYILGYCGVIIKLNGWCTYCLV